MSVRDAVRRVAALAVPIVVPLGMSAVFRETTRRFGERRGIQAGFAVYWATCWGAAFAIGGPRGITAAFRPATPALPGRGILAAALLAVPPVGAVATELLPQVRQAGPRALATSIGLAITNALAEEALWRALPVVMFPRQRILGWLWPAAGFAAWHLAPLRASGAAAGRQAALLVGAGLIGTGSGWVAHRTGSVAAGVIPHIVTDACGVRSARRTWLGG
ncbi:CPBP family intramembrane glutamic endopeptidase [Nakamurella sp. GG22]